MQSNGGVATGEVVCENPAALLVSGPAAGPALGVSLGRAHGVSDLVTADMGGTSFDISIIPGGQVNVSSKKIIDGKKYSLPTVDVNAVGAGGGSIAFIDMSGRLQVGPASAGAVPGPACYGLGGTEPTVTDANLVLGYLNAGYFLGGDRVLRRELAEAAIKAKVADPLGLTVPEAAAAIHDVVNAKMAGAIDVMFSQRGCDPRDFTLIAAGGAAPVHVARLTREAGMKHFISPRTAPVFCAFGMMYADLKHNYTRPYTAQAEAADLGRINELFDAMEADARTTLEREGAAPADIGIERSMDIHYYGQVREQNAAVPAGPVTRETLAATVDAFHEKHRRVIGYSRARLPDRDRQAASGRRGQDRAATATTDPGGQRRPRRGPQGAPPRLLRRDGRLHRRARVRRREVRRGRRGHGPVHHRGTHDHPGAASGRDGDGRPRGQLHDHQRPIREG